MKTDSFTQSGILIVDKPEGITSTGVLRDIKKRLSLPRRYPVGHAGTLDPMATGLLICLIGGSTKLASFFSDSEKCYEGEILFGRTTTTDDVTGETVEISEVEIPPFEEIEAEASKFTGKILQTPPQVSAVRIAGKRAYKRARSGEDFTIPPREVTIEEFSLREGSSPDSVAFTVRCGSGTYIRSIARDLGEALGVGGCLKSLRRTTTGPFVIEDAVQLDDVVEGSISPWEKGFSQCPRISLRLDQLRAISNGNISYARETLEDAFSSVKRYAEGVSQPLFRVQLEDSPISSGLIQRSLGRWKIRYFDKEERARL